MWLIYEKYLKHVNQYLVSSDAYIKFDWETIGLSKHGFLWNSGYWGGSLKGNQWYRWFRDTQAIAYIYRYFE